MPPNLDYEQAAAGTEGAHYALSHIRSWKPTGMPKPGRR